MVANLGSLWLKSLKRLTKAPRAKGRLLVKTSVAKTVRSFIDTTLGIKKSAPPASKSRRRPAVKALAPSAVQAAKQSAVAKTLHVKRALLPARATWQKAYFSFPEIAPMGIPRRMAYWLYVPGHTPSTRASQELMPLIVMLHGCRQTATDIAAATRMNALAERKGFAVLYPHQSSSVDTHRCWHWYKRGVQRGEGDVAMIAHLIAHVQQRHNFDRRRTYAAGLSAGAALATILALRHPNLIAAVGLHSAPVFATSDGALSAYRTMQQGSPHAHSAVIRRFMAEHAGFPGMPAMVIHGDNDAVVRRINADELAQQFLLVNGAQLSSVAAKRRLHAGRTAGQRPRLAYHTDTWYAKRTPYIVNCTVNGLGHAWSGGDRSIDYTEPRGPNASLMLWEFFAHHQRPIVESPAPPSA